MSNLRHPKLIPVTTVLIVIVAATTIACSDSTGVRAVASVGVTPPAQALVVGEKLTFSARALDAAGNVVQGREVAWESTNPSVATVNATGLVEALAPGNVSIRATVDGKVGAAQLTITLAQVSRVEVNPAAVSLGEGESRTLVATALDASGRVLGGREVVWLSGDPAVAEVDASGRLTARRLGTVTITVMIEGHAATVAVTVTRVPVASIAVTPTALILSVGQTRQLTAIVLDAAGNRLTDRVVTWTTDAPAVAEVSASGLVRCTGHGYATITATSEGKSFSLAVTGQDGEADIMPYDVIHHRPTPTAAGEMMILGIDVAGSTTSFTMRAGGTNVRLQTFDRS